MVIASPEPSWPFAWNDRGFRSPTRGSIATEAARSTSLRAATEWHPVRSQRRARRSPSRFAWRNPGSRGAGLRPRPVQPGRFGLRDEYGSVQEDARISNEVSTGFGRREPERSLAAKGALYET